MFSIDTICFQGDASDFFWTLLADSIHMPSIAPVSNSDYNKTDGH